MIEIIQVAHAAEETAQVTSGSGSALQLLGINWKLFLGQLVNFSIILLILWKWVFTPVTDALQKRTKKIEESLKDAESIKRQVAELVHFRKEQKDQAAEEYEEILKKAEMAAGEQRTQILSETRQRSEKILREAEARIAAEKSKMVAEVKEELASLVVAAAEKIISEKLDKDKDAKLTREALSNLKNQE